MNESGKFSDLYIKYPELKSCSDDIMRAYETLITCYSGGGTLLVCGNGGSSADADHIVGELMKGFMRKRPVGQEIKDLLGNLDPQVSGYLTRYLQVPLPAISLGSQSALQTAFANDVAPDLAFAQSAFGYGRKGDVFLGISTSGNSKNVYYAAAVAVSRGLTAIGLTGEDGGMLKDICQVMIRVPETSTPAVQELHLPVYHALCAAVEAHFFRE